MVQESWECEAKHTSNWPSNNYMFCSVDGRCDVEQFGSQIQSTERLSTNLWEHPFKQLRQFWKRKVNINSIVMVEAREYLFFFVHASYIILGFGEET